MGESIQLPDSAQKRKEHLQFCKDRALRDLKDGRAPQLVWGTFVLDMRKREETKRDSALTLGYSLLDSGGLSTRAEMEEFIKGFN